MKPQQILKFALVFLVISFISLYFTTIGSYYEYNMNEKKTLTEEAIKRFEADVKAGKEIIASNYIEEKKDYNNKLTKTTMDISNIITETFTKTLKYIFKQLNKTLNN